MGIPPLAGTVAGVGMPPQSLFPPFRALARAGDGALSGERVGGGKSVAGAQSLGEFRTMRNQPARLPEELSGKFESAERKDSRVAVFLAIAGLVFALFAVFVPFLLVERVWTTPGLVRGVFLLAGLGGMGWFVARWVVHHLRRLRDPFATIRRIEHHYPDLGDSLRGVVELSKDGGSQEGISESLRAAAVQQVAKRCHERDFREAIPTNRLWMYAKRAGAILLILVVGAAVEPELVRNGISRFMRPWARIPRYTFAQLAPLPPSRRVARGEPFTVPVRLADQSRWQPESLRYRLGRGDGKSADMTGGATTLELPGITQDARLKVRLGDTGASVLIEPVARPALLELVGDVTFPSYLERPDKTVECARERPRLVAGSKVSLQGRTLNPLREARLVGTEGASGLQVKGRAFSSAPMPVGALSGGVLHWCDVNGLQPPEPYQVEMEVIVDEPPTTQAHGASPGAVILEDEVLTLEPRAEDDFGIKTVEVSWDVFPADAPRKGAVPTASGRRGIGKGAPDLTEWRGEFQFSPKRLGIPAGSRVELRSKVVDYKPGRAFSESQVFTIGILTPEDHARLVQNRLEALRNLMEEAALREAQQLFDNEQLAKMTDEELRSAEAQRELSKQADLEKEAVKDWQEMAKKAAELLAAATQNEAFPSDVLKEWTEIMDAVQAVSSEMLPEASQSLAQASQSQQQRRENLEKAIEAQKKALEALKKAAQEMGESLEQFAVLNMAARLRALADRERQMSGALQELFPKTIGMAGADLPALLANRVEGLSKSQGTTQKLAFSVQFEIQRCLENTGIEKYGKVVEGMEKAKLDEEMPKTIVAIAGNRLSQATVEVQRWAKSFDEWAEMLDSKKDDGGGGGGGGGGEMSEEAMEFMLALMKAMKNQDQLRRDTKGLDAEKAQIKDYDDQAERLAVAESELGRTVGELAKKLRLSEARNTIEDAQGLMEQAGVDLREPNTGREVRADMSTAIELLASLFDGSSSQSQGQGQGMMAMMAQQMGLQMGMGAGAGASGGGSTAGGPFGGPGGNVPGGLGSGGNAARGGDSVTDVAPADFPVEYRGLLEKFFKKVEAADE